MQSSFASKMAPHEEALPDILMRIVAELHDVAYLIERIEPTISETSDSPLGAAERMMVLQGIDLAVQKTRGLAEFIDTISASVPEELLVDVATALNLVKLADMQKALSGGSLRHGHSQPLNRAVGDFDLF
ncbi:chemotaxis protein CheT [Rhizobium sp.]